MRSLVRIYARSGTSLVRFAAARPCRDPVRQEPPTATVSVNVFSGGASSSNAFW